MKLKTTITNQLKNKTQKPVEKEVLRTVAEIKQVTSSKSNI